MRNKVTAALLAADLFGGVVHAALTPAAQAFRQEVAEQFPRASFSSTPIQLLDCSGGSCRVFAGGLWYQLRDGLWQAEPALANTAQAAFVFPDNKGEPTRLPLPWSEVRQLLRFGETNFAVTSGSVIQVNSGATLNFAWPADARISQVALSPAGELMVASTHGLFRRSSAKWEPVPVKDEFGRSWNEAPMAGLAFDSAGQLWLACRAGVGCLKAGTWTFYEGKDGLPYNDFTAMCAGPAGTVWFATHRGAIRYHSDQWHYRQGPLWLPDDDISGIAVDSMGTAWFATANGLGSIRHREMTLADKAGHYEQEIERYVKRTPFGFVAEAALRAPGDRTTAAPQDSDNDGLWTAMYGAGECFAYAATKSPIAKNRARQAFEALRFLQKVTQGGSPAPPKGFIARTIRPIDWPDPNTGRLEADREAQRSDKLWKAYEPRWPKSGDGKWYWKSDTSSDELDGHYFFYPLYYDFCADTEPERARLREVVRDITDHLIDHGFNLIDHDGRPTRWGIYGPDYLNNDPNWWQERGLKSLSILSYLAVAEHVTGDPKYAKASRELIDRHGYAHNAMHYKIQHGPGSGNQSDDEMAFMCFYNLLRCSKDNDLKALIRGSLFRAWVNEQPEMNPFFNFVCASQNLSEEASIQPFGSALRPWEGWHEDAMATLYGFPLDRRAWAHRNSHRLDLRLLTRSKSSDIFEPDRPGSRGFRTNGKVIPVENRHFNHWNTDPWRLDYGGNGDELAAGTVFLLPYYMGLYHGYIELPH
jgi:hypothetical protein